MSKKNIITLMIGFGIIVFMCALFKEQTSSISIVSSIAYLCYSIKMDDYDSIL